CATIRCPRSRQALPRPALRTPSYRSRSTHARSCTSGSSPAGTTRVRHSFSPRNLKASLPFFLDSKPQNPVPSVPPLYSYAFLLCLSHRIQHLIQSWRPTPSSSFRHYCCPPSRGRPVSGSPPVLCP